MRMANQSNIDGRLDKISNLPDAILCHIISFLPIKDAVRTSILSPRWRYLFASMTRLQIDARSLKKLQSVDSFMNFVDRLLLFSSKPSLECFRLYFSRTRRYRFDSSRVNEWVSAALVRGVEEIDLVFEFGFYTKEPMLPTILFICKSLVTLKLGMNLSAMNVPTGVCLPNLKNLHLGYIEFIDADSVQRLISSCLVLEDLVIDDCSEKISELIICNTSLKRLKLQISERSDWESELSITINAPRLVYLKYYDSLVEGYAGNMPSLADADIRISINCNSERDYERDVYKRAATDLLHLIKNVVSLQLRIEHPEMILVLGPELGRLAFDNLVELKITEELIHHDWRGTWLVEFLQCSPNLQTFDLSLHFDEDYEFDGGWSPPEKELSCLLFRLKKLVLNYNGRWVFEMIKYFLKNARGLEELKVVDHDEWDKELGMNKELLFLPRRSKGCQVLID